MINPLSQNHLLNNLFLHLLEMTLEIVALSKFSVPSHRHVWSVLGQCTTNLNQFIFILYLNT